ncbi:unnamed protein product [Sphagnum compactum]
MATLAEGKDAIREEMVKLSWAMMQQANYSGPAVSLGAAGSVSKNLSLMLQQQPTISAAVAASAMEDVHDITAAAVTSNNANAGVIITPAPRKQFPVQLNLLPPLPCPSSVQSPSKSSSAMSPQLPYTSCSSKYSFPMTWQHPAISLDRSATVFQRTCSGCHAGGGNILQPGATLFAKDLERNDTASVNDIFKITYSGKGRMPGYGENCTPRGQCTFGPRISDSDIRTLAEFVRLQADQGWSKTIDP